MRQAGRARAPQMPACPGTGSATPSPAPGALQFSDLPDDEITLEAAQPIQKQQTVEVVDLVLQRPGEQARAFNRTRAPVSIETLDDRAQRPRHRRVEAGDAET